MMWRSVAYSLPLGWKSWKPWGPREPWELLDDGELSFSLIPLAVGDEVEVESAGDRVAGFVLAVPGDPGPGGFKFSDQVARDVEDLDRRVGAQIAEGNVDAGMLVVPPRV